MFNSQGQVLLTQSAGSGYWQFPKGNIGQRESSKNAALREVKEEGGVEAEIITKVDDSKYVYTHPETKEKIFKVATFYLMNYVSGDIKDHDWEVADSGWFSPEEALKKISFSVQKQFLKKAMAITKHEDEK